MDSEADEKGMTILLMTGHCSTCHKAMQYLEDCIHILEHSLMSQCTMSNVQHLCFQFFDKSAKQLDRFVLKKLQTFKAAALFKYCDNAYSATMRE